MEQTPPPQAPPPASTPQPTEQQPPQPQPPPSSAAPQLSSSSSIPQTSSSSTNPSSPNPNPNPPVTQPQQQSSLQNPQTRQPFNRPWPQPSPYPHFSPHLQSMPPPPSSSSSSSSSPSPPPVPPFSSPAPSSSLSAPLGQKGGIAIGVPAQHHPSPPPPQPTSFASLNPPSFGQQFGGLARSSAANVPESVTGPGTSQVRQPIQGIQGMGTMGSFGSGPQMRPSGIAAHHQQRPVQSSVRPQSTPNNQPPTSQNFQAHGMLRAPSVGSPGSLSPSTSQLHNQPWLSSGSQGKPPLPPSPPVRSITHMLSQRSHIPQQHHRSISTASQQPQASSSQQQQQPSSSHPPQEHYGQQFPSSRDPQSLAHQQQIPRGSGLGNQKPSSHTVVPPSPVQSGPPNRTISPESGESSNRILSKRSIQELVTQIDPSERLDPDVEDILVDIADEFVDSITTFGCSLAKHRKSNTLEAKDILLHLERNWNMTLPGFSGDEIKNYRKPYASDIHKERLAAIRRSIASADTANTRSFGGQAAGNAKSHLPKAPVNFMGSPNPKIREAA